MGQSSSSDPLWDSKNDTNPQRTHYELLGLEPSATDEDIKRAYRRKALELHPDRNYGNIENATRLFAEVQSAYEVLSDPQERAWYDSHRDILSRTDAAGTEEHYQRNVKVTTAEDLAKMCLHRNVYTDFSDSPAGFFATVREVFERLAFEERIACEIQNLEAKDYPSFGCSSDAYEDVVKSFYSIWSNFATQKDFFWKDSFRYGDAPDRRTRRVMEKENKRERDEAIKEFNNAVRTLVTFVKKRDPRHVPNVKTDAERHKSMREKAAAQAAQARAANQARLADVELPTWARTESMDDCEFEESSSEELRRQFECVICNKVFKSENQFEAHEKSKKHIKATQQIRRQMQQEDIALGLDTGKQERRSSRNIDDIGEHEVLPRTSEQNSSSNGTSQGPMERTSDSGPEPPTHPQYDNPIDSETTDEHSSIEADEEYAPRVLVEQRILDSEKDAERPKDMDPDRNDDTMMNGRLSANVNERGTKKGKAKEKRAKKATKAAQANSIVGISCATCQASFSSKTKLHNHLNELGHARPVSKTNDGGRRKVAQR